MSPILTQFDNQAVVTKFIIYFLIAVSCKSLLSPTNGRIIPSLCSAGGKYTQKCSFLCNDGYVRNGADEAVCQEDGRWSAITPTCDKGMLINAATIKG